MTHNFYPIRIRIRRLYTRLRIRQWNLNEDIMIDVHPEHQFTRTKQENGQTKVECSCGQKWTHSKNEDETYMDSIYESHLSYFKKPPTLIL